MFYIEQQRLGLKVPCYKTQRKENLSRFLFDLKNIEKEEKIKKYSLMYSKSKLNKAVQRQTSLLLSLVLRRNRAQYFP